MDHSLKSLDRVRRLARPAPLALATALWLGAVPAGDAARQRSSPGAAGDRFAAARARMVEQQVAARGVADRAVLSAMRDVPRHLFVPAALQDQAYDDRPLPIGHSQTISQPYIVALMTELARVRPSDRVLEIGTGSGYQAAVLSKLASQVYTIEILEPLAREATERLRRLGYRNVTVRHGDGYLGWPEAAPFDAIIVTAAPEQVPAPLIAQLQTGGRLVIPVGGRNEEQVLQVLEKDASGKVTTRRVAPVRFVPLTREKR